MYKLFFLDPEVNLRDCLTIIGTFSILPFSFGVVYLLRYYKARAKRFLWIGLTLSLLLPFLVALALQLVLWYGDYISGPDILTLSLFQR